MSAPKGAPAQRRATVNLEHFDATKYAANGHRLANVGKPSKLRPDEAEQAVFLELIVRTAQKDLSDYLAGLGFESKTSQACILNKLRKGWRPLK